MEKSCQNCKYNFTIYPEDLVFYDAIKVPMPTFCPDCRAQRRLVWRNERTLYKRKCDLCSKSVIGIYPENTPFPVYCYDCWYGDGWDPLSYGVEYDSSVSFFEQLKTLINTVPRLASWVVASTKGIFHQKFSVESVPIMNAEIKF